MSTAGPLRLLTVAEAGERCGISRQSVERLIAAGELEAIDVRSSGTRPRLRIAEVELERWLKTRAIKSTKRRNGAA